MTWATQHIADLKAGRTITFRPMGRSMEPLIRHGQEVTVEPVYSGNGVSVGDVVLCMVKGHAYLHLVKRYNKHSHRFEIGNNKGKINGWIDCDAIYGKRVR